MIARPRTSAPRRRPPTPRLGRVGTRGARAAFLGTGPTAWYDTRDLLATTTQTLTDRVVGATSATLGSTGSSDANDPVALTYNGEGYIWGTGGGIGNYVSIPDAAALDMSADFEVIVRAYSADWATAPATQQMWAARFDGPTGATRAWSFRRGVTTNALTFLFQHPVSGLSTHTATTPAIPAGWAWFRVFVDTDDGGGSRAVTFQWAADQASEPSSWTTISTSTTGNTGAHSASSFPLVIGSDSYAARGLVEGVKRVILRDLSAGSTTVADINPAIETLGHDTWTCTTGQTVTVSRATSGYTTAIVSRPRLMLDGSNDYLQLPTAPTFTAAAGAHTVMVINRVHNLAGAATLSRVWSSESAADNGAHIYLDQTSAQYKVLVGGATTTATTAAAAFTQTTQLHAVAAVFSAGTGYAYSTTTGLTAGVDYSGVGTVTHTTPRIGSRADSVASPADMETYAVVTWNRALTATELATAAAYLLGAYA